MESGESTLEEDVLKGGKEEEEEGKENEDEEGLSLKDTDVIDGMLEIIAILWTGIAQQLAKVSINTSRKHSQLKLLCATHCIYQLRARRVFILFKDVLLKTRRVLLLNRVYGDSALLVLNRTLLKWYA